MLESNKICAKERSRRAKIGRTSITHWQDPVYRKLQVESRKKTWRGNWKKAWSGALGVTRRIGAARRAIDMWATRSEEERRQIVGKISEGNRIYYASPEGKRQMMLVRQAAIAARRKNFDRWRKNLSRSLKGRKVWNKGLTKYDHPSLMARSVQQRGRIPDSGKYQQWYIGKSGRISMRSSWEVAFAVWCDRKGICWLYEAFGFPLGEGPWRGWAYRPDFYLPEYGLFVEVKGRFSPEDFAKMKRFSELYPTMRWLMLRGNHLHSEGILA